VISRQTQVDGVLKVAVSGLQRTAIVRLINDGFLAAEVAPIEETRGQSAEADALSRAVLDAYQIYADVDFSSLPPGPKARFGLPSIGDPSLLADTIAPLLSTGIEKEAATLGDQRRRHSARNDPRSDERRPPQELEHEPEKYIAAFPRDKRGTRLCGDHAQSKT
jgi:hypothetical protein